MPLKSVLGGSTRRPDITFHRDGKIDITSKVVEKLGIEPGDSLDLVADDYECAVTVIHHTVDGQFKAKCKRSKEPYRNMRSNCKELTDFICNRFGADTVRLTTGCKIRTSDGSTALTLINRSL